MTSFSEKVVYATHATDVWRNKKQILEAEGKHCVDFALTTMTDATQETDLDLAMDRRVYEHRKKLYEQSRGSTPYYREERGDR